MPKDQRKQLARPREVKVAAADIQRMLAEIPDMGASQRRRFTRTEDAFIKAGWGVKSQVNMARYLNISVGTMRRRYFELTEGKGI